MMRLQIARSWDFNQMLVASVFGHLLLLTFVLFLPKPTILDNVIPPAFMVELVEITKGDKRAAQKSSRKKVRPKKTAQEKVPPVPPAPTETKPAPKLIEPIQPPIQVAKNNNASDQILSSLDQLNKPPSKVEQELGQLAKLVPKVSLKKPVIKKSTPILEKTFDEMKALKNKKVELLPNKVEPLAMENPLDQFENLKMEDTLDVEPPPNEPPVEETIDSKLKELELASLSKFAVKPDKIQDEKSSADLLKELAEMERPPIENQQAIANPEQGVKAPPVLQEKSQAFDSILKKLDSLETEPKDIEANIRVPETFTQNFQSDIRKVSAPKQVEMDVVISPNQAYVQSPLPGNPGADALALYKGMIIQKVMANWHAPLGQDHNKKVIVSFNIYPKGNIDRPDLKKSSQVELLDSLALRAIRESEPFPKFPESLKSSNLNINIHFKYIPEKTKHDS